MGFYGNVTGVASTQFSFDKTFPNRVALDGNPAGDGVYINRFVLIEYGEKQSDDYKRNEEIDMNKYQANYDSTVWQKIYSDNGTVKYVMIAELNAAIPKFGLVPVAPSEVPLTPEFDKFSTDDHYTLRWQVPWGFRVKPATESEKSDATTTYKIYSAVIQNEKPTFDNNGKINYTISENSANASIYFNNAGFSKTKSVHDEISKNEIKLSTASSGKLYETSNDESRDWATAEDIQELSISLPAIGNMVADGYDIIYGKNRDKSKSESLQGILDTYTEMEGNKIPYKRLSTGEIVGAELAGDSWIAAQLDDNNQQINITHKDPVSISDSSETINLNNGGNQFNYYTLTTDNKGHVKKGTKTTTVIVPNGFNEIKDINGASLVKATTPTSAFKIATDNWIKVNKSEDSEATLKLYHETHSRNWEYQEVNKSNDKTYFEFNATGVVDDAGHIEYYSPTKVYFPWSFSKIQSDEESSLINAKKVNDTFKIGGDHKWTETRVDGNEILVEHKIKTNAKKEKFTDYSGVGYNCIDVIVDEAGHIIEHKEHFIPYGLVSTDIYQTNGTLFQISALRAKNPTKATVEIYGDDFINLTGVTSTELSEDQKNIVYNTGFKIQHKATGVTPPEVPAITNNKIYVNNVNWDSAGHIVECDPKEYTLLTLKTPSSDSSITQNENDGSITIKGNTIIQHPDENDKSVSVQTQWIDVSHQDDVITIDHKDPNTTDINKVELGNSNSLTVPYLSYDSKGHVFNGGTKELIGDDWLAYEQKIVADEKDNTKQKNIITISHNPAQANNLTYAGRDLNVTEDQTFIFEPGDTIIVPYIGYDSKGHVYEIKEQQAKLPIQVGAAKVIIKDEVRNDENKDKLIMSTISSIEDGGQIVPWYTTTDQLKLNNYTTPLTDTGNSSFKWFDPVNTNDSINTALGKLEYQLHNSENLKKNETDNITISDSYPRVDNMVNGPLFWTSGDIIWSRMTLTDSLITLEERLCMLNNEIVKTNEQIKFLISGRTDLSFASIGGSIERLEKKVAALEAKLNPSQEASVLISDEEIEQIANNLDNV